MKRFILGVILAASLCSTLSLFAQTGTGSTSNYIPELVFQNPVLVSGIAGQDGSVYRFNNIAKDLDATVTVKSRSAANVVLTNIDVANQGWTKAFQPQLGIPGNVPVNTSWWMEFEMRFFKAGTTDRKKVKGFKVTAIDVDGDGVSIRETIQMNRVKAVQFSPLNYLVEGVPAVINNLYDNDADDARGIDKLLAGPVTNFTNIDTNGTAAMSTFTYEEKDMISFRYGGKSGGVISNAGERLNSLWFKAFDLSVRNILPVRLQSFSALFDKKNANLAWSTSLEESFSHFVVERSTDGKGYADAGLVFALGTPNGTETPYKFKDANVSSSTGALYYRLRMVDLSGEISYSDVKVVRLTAGAISLNTFPNPVTDALRVTLPDSWQGKAVGLELFNSNGNRVQASTIAAAGQTENLRLGNLPKGLYVVKASCSGAVAEQKIIKN